MERNKPCPCQSGLKYKKCCLKKDEAKRKISPYKPKKGDLKFERVPQEQVTAKQAKEVIERMSKSLRGINPLKPKKVTLWTKIIRRIKEGF